MSTASIYRVHAEVHVCALAAPVKLADGTVAKYIGVQVDVTRTTEGSCSAFADGAMLEITVHAWVLNRACLCAAAAGSGVPLLVKYDSRVKASTAGPVGDVLQVRCAPGMHAGIA